MGTEWFHLDLDGLGKPAEDDEVEEVKAEDGGPDPKKHKKGKGTGKAGNGKRKEPPTTVPGAKAKAAAKAAARGAAKAEKATGSSNPQNPRHYKDMAAQVTQLSRDMAFCLSMLLHVYTVPSESLFIKIGQKVGKMYYAKVKENRYIGKEIGPPYIFMWRAWVEVLIRRTKMDVEVNEGLILHLSEDCSDWEQMMEWLKTARISKGYEENQYKLYVNIAAFNPKMDKVLRQLDKALKEDGGEVKQSVAPPGPRERKIATLHRGGYSKTQDQGEEEEA